MPLSEFEKRRAEQLLEGLARRRVPAHLRDQLRLGWSFRGDAVTLYESRPLLRNPACWADSKIAQFRRQDGGRWSLYWVDRTGRWRPYDTVPPGRLDTLMAEVCTDPTGIFWG